MVITAPTRAIVIFPGGFGTLHHFFEILTLMQTKKMEKIPIILYDRKHWEPLHKYIKSYLVHDIHTISDEDDELYQIVDDRDSVIKVIRDYYSR
jgi:predicted Rossmann-fold nucleotide-binding protein